MNEKAKLAIAKLLMTEVWYSDIQGSLVMAQRILDLVGENWEIVVKKKKWPVWKERLKVA